MARGTGDIVTGLAASLLSFGVGRVRTGKGMISADPRYVFVLIVVRSSILRSLGVVRCREVHYDETCCQRHNAS
jgi:hypothetical protein